MLKHFKPVSLILVAGAITLPTSVYANLAPEKQETAITQQSGKVSGVVEDDFGPVAGASVIVKGTTNGIMTDMDGNFTLEGVKKGDIIVISFIGYTTQEIPYTGQSTLQIKLAEDTQKLDEVVVTGYNTVNRRDMVGSYTSVKAADVIMPAYNSIDQMLQGQIAGVQVNARTGQPGESMMIRVRGSNSLAGGNEPLYVIDGVMTRENLSLIHI